LSNEREVSVCAVHLNPISAELRLAAILHAVVAPPAIVLGDFNAYRADDPGAEDALARFSPRHRARAGTTDASDSGFQALEDAGFVDLFRQAHPGEPGHTIAAAGGLRLDYIFATSDLAQCATRCDVLRSAETARASDHLPLVAEFELDE
jgi:exodeoxyribonuclease-3